MSKQPGKGKDMLVRMKHGETYDIDVTVEYTRGEYGGNTYFELTGFVSGTDPDEDRVTVEEGSLGEALSSFAKAVELASRG